VREQEEKMRIAAIQMTSTPDKRANLAQARALLADACRKKAELVAFPEVFSFIADRADTIKKEAEPLNGTTVETLREWAAERRVWILGGSILLRAQKGLVTNTSLLISPEGLIAARYDKIHLFDADIPGDRSYRESKYIKPGRKPVAARTPFGALALSVCYDIRFPELYRKLTHRHDIRIIFVPAAFTVKSGEAHWDLLTRARAVENQAYVVAPAQCGIHYPGRETYGHSRIVDPWGKVIAEKATGPGVVLADIDFTYLEETRKRLPALKNRRLEC
jgi:predicted amidohydrolase